MLLRFGCTGCLAVFFASLVQRRPIAAVSRARLAGRFDVVDGFRELLACLSRAILPEAENRKRSSRRGQGGRAGMDRASQIRIATLIHVRNDRLHPHRRHRRAFRAGIKYSPGRSADAPIPEIRTNSLQIG